MRGSILHNPAGDCENCLAVYKIKFGRIETALIASAEKGFEKPVVERIGPFLSIFDYRRGTLGQPCDFFGQSLVPELPGKALRYQLGNFSSTATILALDCDNFDHILCPSLNTGFEQQTGDYSAIVTPPFRSFFFRKNDKQNMTPAHMLRIINISI